MNDVIHIIPRRFLLSAKNNQNLLYEEKEFFQLPFENYWVANKKAYNYKKQNEEISFYKYGNFNFKHLFGQLKEIFVGKDLHTLFFDMICYLKDVDCLGNLIIKKKK